MTSGRDNWDGGAERGGRSPSPRSSEMRKGMPERGRFGLSGLLSGLLGMLRRGRRADPRAQLAAVELDLRERDAELDRLRAEYDRLARASERARAEATEAGVAALAGRLARPLSQLATMQALCEAGREVRVGDVLKLAKGVEAALLENGVRRVGGLGEQVAFDPRLHQPLTQVELQPGLAVRIRFHGYRLGETVLLRAQVSPHDEPRARTDAASAEGDDR